MDEAIQRKSEKRTVKRLVLVWGIVLIIAAVLIFIFLNSDKLKRSSLKGTVELYYEAIEERDIDKYKSLVPDYWKEKLRASYNSIINYQFEKNCSTFNCSDNVNLSIKINDIYEYDRDALNTIKEKFANWYHAEKIEAFAIVDVDICDNKRNKWNNDELAFIKIDGKWYKAYGNY